MVQCDRIIIILLAVIITVPVIIKSRPSRLAPVSAVSFVSSTSGRGYVRVSGDVRHPGIYPISANMMTVNAIKMAEPLQSATGFIPDGCEAFVVRNGTGLRVARHPKGASEVFFESLPTAHRIVLGIALDINTMTAEDFERIPGIGTVLARRIIEYRQINGGKMEVKDLVSIEGIGENKYNHLEKYFKGL